MILPYLFGTYITVSLLLFVFPIKRKQNKFKHPLYLKALSRQGLLHISHRGGSRDRLENTIDAFENAKQQGTDCLEMDVCMTKDKKVKNFFKHFIYQIIVIHDSLLERMTGVNQHVHEFNYDELPKFKTSIRIDFIAKECFESESNKFQKFPLLEEVFQKFPTTLMNIEIKTPNPETNKQVSVLIKKYNREQLTIWGARCIELNLCIFQDKNQSDDLYRENPNIARFFSLERILLVYLTYLVGLLPFLNVEEDSMQIPLFTDDLFHWKHEDAPTNGKKREVKIYFNAVKFLNFISKPLFWHLNRRGVLVFYWVLNEEKDYERAFLSGVNGIMTDRPGHLKEFLSRKKYQID